MPAIHTEKINFDCKKMGSVILTQNTPIKTGAKFPSVIEECSHSKECGVGLPFTKEKCDSMRNTI